MFSAAIFDMDGLLVDSERTIMNAWIDVARAHGTALSAADYLQTVGRSFREGQAILAGLLGDDAFRAVSAQVREQLAAPRPHRNFRSSRARGRCWARSPRRACRARSRRRPRAT